MLMSNTERTIVDLKIPVQYIICSGKHINAIAPKRIDNKVDKSSEWQQYNTQSQFQLYVHMYIHLSISM